MPATRRKKKVSVSGKPGDVRRVMTITVDADDDTLNRLSTLMLFARPPVDWTEVPEPPMPWPLGEEGKPAVVRPPLEAMREEITKRLTWYVARHGIELAKNFLAEYGVLKVTELYGQDLDQFYDDLVLSTSQYQDGTVAPA